MVNSIKSDDGEHQPARTMSDLGNRIRSLSELIRSEVKALDDKASKEFRDIQHNQKILGQNQALINDNQEISFDNDNILYERLETAEQDMLNKAEEIDKRNKQRYKDHQDELKQTTKVISNLLIAVNSYTSAVSGLVTKIKTEIKAEHKKSRTVNGKIYTTQRKQSKEAVKDIKDNLQHVYQKIKKHLDLKVDTLEKKIETENKKYFKFNSKAHKAQNKQAKKDLKDLKNYVAQVDQQLRLHLNSKFDDLGDKVEEENRKYFGFNSKVHKAQNKKAKQDKKEIKDKIIKSVAGTYAKNRKLLRTIDENVEDLNDTVEKEHKKSRKVQGQIYTKDRKQAKQDKKEIKDIIETENKKYFKFNSNVHKAQNKQIRDGFNAYKGNFKKLYKALAWTGIGIASVATLIYLLTKPEAITAAAVEKDREGIFYAYSHEIYKETKTGDKTKRTFLESGDSYILDKESAKFMDENFIIGENFAEEKTEKLYDLAAGKDTKITKKEINAFETSLAKWYKTTKKESEELTFDNFKTWYESQPKKVANKAQSPYFKPRKQRFRV